MNQVTIELTENRRIATIRPGRVDGNDGKFGIRQDQVITSQWENQAIQNADQRNSGFYSSDIVRKSDDFMEPTYAKVPN